MKEEKKQDSDEVDLSKAKESKARRFSLVWVIPIIAFIVFVILLWNNSLNKGPQITIKMPSAESVEEGKTLVKLHSVTVGRVTEIKLDDDYDSAVLTVQMAKDTEDLLNEDSLFWVVKPRVETTSISGLDTLISGSYIEMRRGKSDKMSATFSMLLDPPTDINNTKGIELILYSDGNKRLNPGDFVTYRGFNVGNVLSSSLDLDNKRIRYVIFIADPYTKLVDSNTRFWISSGIDVSIGTEGVNFNTESINNILRGGIAFDSFSSKKGEMLAPLSEHNLFKNQNEARIDYASSGILYAVMVENGLQKIKQGADVVFQGIKVGEVITAPWLEKIDTIFTDYKQIPILIAINAYDSSNLNKIRESLDNKLKQGKLCASAVASSFISGNNQIELRYLSDSEKAVFADNKVYRNVNVIPYLKAGSLQNEISSFINRLEQFDVEGISNNVKTSLASVTDAMKAFEKSNLDVNKSELIQRLTVAFTNFNETVKSYGPDSDTYKKLNATLKDLDRIVSELSLTATKIGNKPNSLIFGSDNKDPIPLKKQ